MDINDLKRQRAERAGKARELLNAVQTAGRELTSDEEATFDRLMEESDKLDKDIDREEKLRAKELRIADLGDTTRDRNGPDNATTEQDAAFRAYMLGGRGALSAEQARALNMSSDPEGGYLVAPQKFVQDLIKKVDDDVLIRGLATVMTLTDGESLGVPTLDTDLNDADWTSEIATGSQDDALRFGKRELRPHPLAKRVKMSRTLLRRASMGPETIVQDRLAYKFGISQEKAFMTGDGNQKPLGLFTATSQGISTARDKVVYDQSDATFLANGLIDAKYFLKAGYWRKARWLWHRDAVKGIRKLRDDTGGAGLGNFLWQPGLAGGAPDTILDLPYLVSEYVPNTFTSGLYIGMLGDFSYYWIVDSLAMEVQRLVELYAETNQVGFIGRLETDAMPVLEEPFVRLAVQS